ncbi:MAG: hypothetical protein KKG88_07570 [Proteobacteria bacterium]|jgi:hypothetical protein|nr:hypothetical protein [Pseudomonadota bacterium]
MNEQEKEKFVEMTRYILASKTKHAKDFRQLVSFYHATLDKAPPLPEPKKEDAIDTALEQIRDMKKTVRNLYKKRTGQKWRPSLRVIQGGGNTTPTTVKVTHHKKPLP